MVCDRKRLCKVHHHHLCSMMGISQSLYQWRALPSSSPISFPGSQEIAGSARIGAAVSWEMPVGCGCLIFTFRSLSPLTKSHPNIKHTLWINATWGYTSPETIITGNCWLHCCSPVSEKELVVPEQCLIPFLHSFPHSDFQRTLKKNCTRPSWLQKAWLLGCFLVYGGWLRVPLAPPPPSSASRFREECHQCDTLPPRGTWRDHMAAGI